VHELSIANALVETAVEAAREAGASKVTVVHLRLGQMAGVVKGSLDFCYELATQGTLLEGSRLEIEQLPVEVYCPSCQEVVKLANVQWFHCPHCDTPSADIRQGKELEIESLEIES
jgi:hydrogenase nickel incorporation protein HypA/HybF